MEKKKIGYMCTVDYDHHLGADCDPKGAKVFGSQKQLEDDHKLEDSSCGIYEVEVVVKKIVRQGKY